MTEALDVAVIGGGQSGLATGYFLARRTSRSYAIFDRAEVGGGAWQHFWPSLRAFSPSSASSLPGWQMPSVPGSPSRDHVVAYLRGYEERYALPVHRPVAVRSVSRHGSGFALDTSAGQMRARAVVSATGTWARPWVPPVPGAEDFAGEQIHTAGYRGPEPFAGRRVLVVGGGNSGAQILAEVSEVARTTWVTARPPRFLPDDVDGRALFAVAHERYRALSRGEADPGGVGGLGDIVMVPPVREARARGVLVAHPPLSRLTSDAAVWADGTTAPIDAVIWCTGFGPELEHLAPLGVVGADGVVATDGTRALGCPGLWLVGYGDWTGAASATLIGVGHTARATVAGIDAWLRQPQPAAPPAS